MEKPLYEILGKLRKIEFKLDNIVTDVQDLKKLKSMVNELYELKPKIEESHQWLNTLVENKEVHRADIDSIK